MPIKPADVVWLIDWLIEQKHVPVMKNQHSAPRKRYQPVQTHEKPSDLQVVSAKRRKKTKSSTAIKVKIKTKKKQKKSIFFFGEINTTNNLHSISGDDHPGHGLNGMLLDITRVHIVLMGVGLDFRRRDPHLDMATVRAVAIVSLIEGVVR